MKSETYKNFKVTFKKIWGYDNDLHYSTVYAYIDGSVEIGSGFTKQEAFKSAKRWINAVILDNTEPFGEHPDAAGANR